MTARDDGFQTADRRLQKARQRIHRYKDPSYYEASRSIAKTRHQVSHALAEFYTLQKDPIQKATWMYKYKRAIDNAIHNVLENKQEQSSAIQRALAPSILPQDVQRLKNDLYDILKEIRKKESMYRISQVYKIILPPIPLGHDLEKKIYQKINDLKDDELYKFNMMKKNFNIDWDGDHGICTPIFYQLKKYRDYSFDATIFSMACCTTIQKLLNHFRAEAGRYSVRVLLVPERNTTRYWHEDDKKENTYTGIIFLPPSSAPQTQSTLSTQYINPVKPIQILSQRIPFFMLTGHAANIIHKSPTGQADRYIGFNIQPFTDKNIQQIPDHFQRIQGLESCPI